MLCSYLPGNFKQEDEDQFNKDSVLALNNIIDYYNADLCMISSWNSKFKDEEHYKSFLTAVGIKVNNLYIGEQHIRNEYIKNKIEEGLKYYLIIDDEAHHYYKDLETFEYKRILMPNRYRCLDKYDVMHVTKNWKLN